MHLVYDLFHSYLLNAILFAFLVSRRECHIILQSHPIGPIFKGQEIQ